MCLRWLQIFSLTTGIALALSVRQQDSRVAVVNPLTLARRSWLAALSRKAEQPLLLDLRGLSSVCDYQFVCSGTNPRQTKAISVAIEEQVWHAFALHPLAIEGQQRGEWISIDYGLVIVHIFRREVRSYYEFDTLWPQADHVTMG